MNIYERIQKALKGVTDVTTLGTSVLQPRKFNRFVRQMEHDAVVIPEARFMAMTSDKEDIDRIGFSGRIVTAGRDDSNVKVVIADGSEAEPSTFTNQLSAQEIQAVAALSDDALRKNIERGNFDDTLVDLIGEAAGRDVEEFALLSDTDIPFGTDALLSKTDGWIDLAAQRVYGGTTAGFPTPDFVSTDAEDIFNTALNALPKQFFKTPGQFRFYVPYRIYDLWVETVVARQTGLGDSVIQSGRAVPWKGIPVVYTPMLERSAALPDSMDATIARDRIEGEVALLANPSMMAWGVFHEITLETDRRPRDRQTDFVLTMEGDAHYEDENSAVAILVDKAPNV